MPETLTKTEYYVDTDNSELSFRRSDPQAIRELTENIETMLETAKLIGTPHETLTRLADRAAAQPVEEMLNDKEQIFLRNTLAELELDKLGVLHSKFGIIFGNSPYRGDGTIPVLTLEDLIEKFQNLLNILAEKTCNDEDFPKIGGISLSGVVSLTARNSNATKSQVALHIRDTTIKVMKPQVVWQEIQL